MKEQRMRSATSTNNASVSRGAGVRNQVKAPWLRRRFGDYRIWSSAAWSHVIFKDGCSTLETRFCGFGRGSCMKQCHGAWESWLPFGWCSGWLSSCLLLQCDVMHLMPLEVSFFEHHLCVFRAVCWNPHAIDGGVVRLGLVLSSNCLRHILDQIWCKYISQSHDICGKSLVHKIRRWCPKFECPHEKRKIIKNKKRTICSI